MGTVTFRDAATHLASDFQSADPDLAAIAALTPTDGQQLTFSTTLGAWTLTNPTGASELASATNITGTLTTVSVASAAAGVAVDVPATAISVPNSNGRPVTLHCMGNAQQSVAATGVGLLSMVETTSGATVLGSVIVNLPNSASLPVAFLDTFIGQYSIGAVSTTRTFKLQFNIWTLSGAGTIQLLNATNNPTFLRAVAG